MVHVMRGAVHDGLEQLGHLVATVVDGDGPEVDGDEEEQVGELVHGEEEDVEVVRKTLHEPVDGVERVAGEWSWNLNRGDLKLSKFRTKNEQRSWHCTLWVCLLSTCGVACAIACRTICDGDRDGSSR